MQLLEAAVKALSGKVSNHGERVRAPLLLEISPQVYNIGYKLCKCLAEGSIKNVSFLFPSSGVSG